MLATSLPVMATLSGKNSPAASIGDPTSQAPGNKTVHFPDNSAKSAKSAKRGSTGDGEYSILLDRTQKCLKVCHVVK